MPPARRTPDDVIINPAYVHSVGQQVKGDAQQFLDPGTDGVQDLQNTLTTLNDDNFPIQLYSTFYQFINIHVQAFTEIFQDRQKIGDGLMDSADDAEKNEIRTVASFQATPLTGTDGPAQLTLP